MGEAGLGETVRLLVLTAALTVVLAVTAGASRAESLLVKHKPWHSLTTHQKVVVLRKQIHKDKCVIRFWKNHRDLASVDVTLSYKARTQTHWARVSLRISRKHLRSLRVVSSPSVGGGGPVQSVICRVFGSACSQALAVARCESGFSINAVNGQYLGLFQMGSHERATFATIGYSTAYEQTMAAHNYYAVSGWGPWSCRP